MQGRSGLDADASRRYVQPVFAIYIYKCQLFAKTGSGQTWEKLKKWSNPNNPPLFPLNASAENGGFVLPRHARDKNQNLTLKQPSSRMILTASRKNLNSCRVCVCVFCLKRNTGEADDLRGPSFSIPGKHPVFVACQFFNQNLNLRGGTCLCGCVALTLPRVGCCSVCECVWLADRDA